MLSLLTSCVPALLPSMPRRDELSRCLLPEAEKQLVALYSYIAAAASPDIAVRYTEAIVSYCESLCSFLHRGTIRDDVRPGLRITNYKKHRCHRIRRGRRAILQDDFDDSKGR